MQKFLIIGLAFCLVLAGCSKGAKEPAPASKALSFEPYDSFYSSLKSSLNEKNHPQALSIIKSIKEAVWAEAPLMLANAKFVKSSENTYGVYQPEEDDVYDSGEPIYLYIEPAGYKILKNEAGYYEFGFSADFQVASESGEILGGQQEFARLPFRSWNPNSEVSITFTYNFSGLPSGKYKIMTTVSDLNSDKKATTENWFTIR